MLVIKIILGLVGLGIIVFVHELGHFLASRLVGIDVEAFSIGWGRPILRKKIGGVEYRLGMFPIGGYCKMRGDNEFQEAWENRRNSVEPVKGTFFGAGPFKRIIVCFAGPLFNFLFAIVVLSFVWGSGIEIHTLGNRIVLAADINPAEHYPADEAGLKTGDRIIAVDGKKTEYSQDIQEIVAMNPDKPLSVDVERGGETFVVPVKPSLDKSSGAGKIGVYFWNDPVAASVADGSPAAAAGMKPGDRIVSVNGTPIPYTAALYPILDKKPQLLNMVVERDGAEKKLVLVPVYNPEGSADLGIAYKGISYKTPALPPHQALVKGAVEGWNTVVNYILSLRVLFKGIDLTQAVSGPVRITYMLGDTASAGFGRSVGAGLRTMGTFLALISVALGVMNLLPLPVLDGGMIVLFIVEALMRRPLHPRAVGIFQTLGVVLIFGLMIFALFGDILFLTGH